MKCKNCNHRITQFGDSEDEVSDEEELAEYIKKAMEEKLEDIRKHGVYWKHCRKNTGVETFECQVIVDKGKSFSIPYDGICGCESPEP